MCNSSIASKVPVLATTYKRYNPRAGKKKHMGDLGSRKVREDRCIRPEISSRPIAGSVSYPNQQSTMTASQLKRKIEDMENQATAVNDRVIELEVAVREKDVMINKQCSYIKSLKEQNSDDKRSSYLVSPIYAWSIHQFCYLLLNPCIYMSL
jgi:hypothetical protein